MEKFGTVQPEKGNKEGISKPESRVEALDKKHREVEERLEEIEKPRIGKSVGKKEKALLEEGLKKFESLTEKDSTRRGDIEDRLEEIEKLRTGKSTNKDKKIALELELEKLESKLRDQKPKGEKEIKDDEEKPKTDGENEEDAGLGGGVENVEEKSVESVLKDKREALAEEYSKLREKNAGMTMANALGFSNVGKEYERIDEKNMDDAERIAHLENEYRESLKAYRKELFEKNPDGAEEIIEKTVVNEAIEFNNLKTDFRLKKNGLGEKMMASVSKVVESYTRMPKKYKYALTAALFGIGATAVAVGGVTGAAILTGVVAGKGIQRVFSTAATSVGVEAWGKGRQEKKEKKEAIEAFGGFTKEALNKKNAKLDKMLFGLEGSKKGKKYGRFVLAGTAGALMYSGLVGDAIGKGFGLGKELLGFGEVDAPVLPETVEVKPNVPSEVSDTLPENPDGPMVDAGGGLEEEYDTNRRDPFEPFKEEVIETVLNENTIVKPGDGIERILQRQLEYSPEKFGYTGDIKDSVTIAKWADGESHSLAIKNGFFDKDTGSEVHLRYDENNPVNYVLKENGFIDRVNSVGHEYEHPSFRNGISESVVGVASESAGEGDPVPYHGTLDGESMSVEESVTLETEKTVAPITITENPNAEGVNLKNEITIISGDNEMVVRVFGEEGESYLVNEPGSNAVIESTTADEARIYDKDGNLLGVVDGDVRGLSAEEIAQKAQAQMNQIREVEVGKIESVSEAEAKIIEEKEVLDLTKTERFEAGKAIRISYPHLSMDTTNIILDLNEYTSGAFTPEALAQQFDTVIGNEPDKFFDGARFLVDDNNNVKIEFTHKANLGTVDMLFNNDGTIAVDGFGGENLNAKVATPYSFADAFRFISSGVASREVSPLQDAIIEQKARDEVTGGLKSVGKGIKNFLKFLVYRK